MATKRTLKSKIANRIKRKAGSVFLRKDFADLGGYDQVGRALRQLVQEEVLVNVGYGLYARAERSTLTGNLIPEKSIIDLAKEFLSRRGIETTLTKYEKLYMEERSTQVPTGRVIGVEGRISRKIHYNGARIHFEQYP